MLEEDLSPVQFRYSFTVMEYICLIGLNTFILIMLSCSFALECFRHYQLDDNVKNIQNMEYMMKSSLCRV